MTIFVSFCKDERGQQSQRREQQEDEEWLELRLDRTLERHHTMSVKAYVRNEELYLQTLHSQCLHLR